MLAMKHYPKAVIMRKGVLIAIVLLITTLLLLTVYNLNHAGQSQSNKMNSPADQKSMALASKGDIWYENQALHKPPLSSTTPNTVTKEKPVVSQGQTTETAQSAQQQQDYQKAMTATISSNQINSELPSSGNKSTAETLSGSSNGSPTNLQGTPDQNKQAEKMAFINANHQATMTDYLGSTLKNPISPFEVKAGTIIPGILLTGINSDLPGQIIAQVRSNVYDTVTGKYVLIPQGAKITGLYDSQVTFGQERVLIVWKRILFPNGQSIDLEGMPGIDLTGYAGFNDEVNHHYTKLFGSVLLMSLLSSGAQLAQPQNSNNNPFSAPTVNQTLAQSLGTNIANTGTSLLSKNMNVQPTLEIRQGYLFNINVTKDMVFPNPYVS